jgi:hypothetical protein
VITKPRERGGHNPLLSCRARDDDDDDDDDNDDNDDDDDNDNNNNNNRMQCLTDDYFLFKECFCEPDNGNAVYYSLGPIVKPK